jgi:hypothetical protein
VEVLDPEVTVDGAGTGGALPRVVGREKVGPRLLQYLGSRSNATLLSWIINGQPAVVVTRDAIIVSVLLLGIRDDFVHHVRRVGDPVGLVRATRSGSRPGDGTERSRLVVQ